jgi:hypothetical protein
MNVLTPRFTPEDALDLIASSRFGSAPSLAAMACEAAPDSPADIVQNA